MLTTSSTGQMSQMVTGHERSTKEKTCNQYKPNISVFIRGTGSIKDNQIRETEHRFNWETYSSSAGAV